ncbi:MAG: hypothetical protein JNM56_16000 [Planctomycetia bacterium]|nr:hypothetical protein [Planctomycetia bacterium]
MSPALTAAIDELRAAHRRRRDWLRRAAPARVACLALLVEGRRIEADLEAAFARLTAAVGRWDGPESERDSLRLTADLDQLEALMRDGHE